jgi:4-hydroxy-tetrahydrodipicolinate reductase
MFGTCQELKEIKVVQYGLGAIGISIVETLLSRPGLTLVGAIDIDKSKVGKDVGQLLEKPRDVGVIVSDKPSDVLRRTSPNIVTHATSSRLESVAPQLNQIIESGASVVSTAEELSYPFVKYPDLAKKIDENAQQKKVVALGTGVNPGFVLDVLAATLSGACQAVSSIRAERVVDASRRRLSLQKKIGAGLGQAEFERRVSAGSVKHVGLPESVGLIALAMGWKVGEIQERITPVIAETDINAGSVKVPAGAVAGVRQVAKGILAGQELIVLDLRIYMGAQNPHDSILIDGIPPVDLVIRGGIQGDKATPAIIANALPKIEYLNPGLRTMLDLPPISPRSEVRENDRSVMLKTF